jgi:acyl-phosphate glycerol 3-phosphate acyltransferase
MATVCLTFLISYLIGGIPFGFLIARSRGVDIFRAGSGNIGATNVGRVLGKRFGILVFVLDFAKGALPVPLASLWASPMAPDLPADLVAVTAGLAAILGHLFPVYLKFRGGKGVATSAGVVALLAPLPALGALLVWLAAVSAWRYVSLASLLAAVALCVVRMVLTPAPWRGEHIVLTAFCFLAALLVFVRHRSNLARLFRGNENQIKDSPTMRHLVKTVHVLALGLWFGSGIFFTFFVALSLFQTFEALGTSPSSERPSWLGESFNKENGIQLAGMAVGPMFPDYFLLQAICGLLAASTALGWTRDPDPSSRRVHLLRSAVLGAALLGVIGGWPIAEKVSELRAKRYSSEPAVAASAKSEFAQWHGYSLGVNMATLALVTVGMALAAQLPASRSREAA